MTAGPAQHLRETCFESILSREKRQEKAIKRNLSRAFRYRKARGARTGSRSAAVSGVSGMREAGSKGYSRGRPARSQGHLRSWPAGPGDVELVGQSGLRREYRG